MPNSRRSRVISACVVALVLGLSGRDAHAQLRGHWRLQETDGDTAVDTSSFENNGDYRNGVSLASSTPVPSDGAIAARFDGSNDFVAIPSESTYDFTGPMTVACWIKVDAFDASDQAIVCKGNDAWRLTREGNTNFVQFACNGLSTTKVVSSTSVNDGQWHHVAGVYTGSQLRIYVDGALSNAVNSSGSINTNNRQVQIARNVDVSGREFDGAIYNVVIYNGALDGPTIQALYNWDGLTAHWKLNETSGTTAADSTMLANHGTYTGGVALAAQGPYSGLGEKAANFDGSNDYVAVPNEFYYDLSSPFSIAAWFKVDAFDTNDQAIVTKGNNAWRLSRNGNTDYLHFQCNGLSSTSVVGTTPVNDGAWHHVAAVYTGSQLQLYLDGVLESSVAATGTISRNDRDLNIARFSQGAGREFDGRIYDVRLYSVPLSAAKVSELYGLVGHWRLNETSGTTAADSSPCAKNATLTGGANWATRCNGSGTFDFNGSSQYFSVANASHLQPTQMLSIAAWIKPDSFGAGSEVNAILRKGDNNPNNYQLALADGKVALYLDQNDDQGIRSNTVLVAGRWYHVAGTWDGTTARIYINGILDASAPRSGTIGTDTRPLHIGGRPGADYFDGQIQELRFYNRPLTTKELARFSGLVGQWRFAEGAGSTTADDSLLDNDASLSGATWTSDCAGFNALQFNGSGGVAATTALFTPPDEGTVTFWMRSSGTPGSTERLFGTGGDWEVRQGNDGRLSFDLCGDAGSNAVSSVPLDEAGRWYHVAASFNSADDSYAIYIDGKLDTSGTTAGNLTQQPADILTFGTRTGSNEYWQGALRDVRVYSRRLCPGEIAELYGLIGHWKLDESSGTAAADDSGAANHGIVIGTPSWVAGKINNAIQLNGSNYVSIAGLLDRPRNCTLAAWAKLNAPDSGGAELVSIGDSFAIRLDNGSSTQTFFHDGSTWINLYYGQSYAGTGWHHFAAVFDDDNNYCRLYVDGVQRANLATTASINYAIGSITAIGRHGNGGTAWDFNGQIDDVRIYSRPLCPTEIQQLFSGSAPVGVKIIKWVEIQ